MVVIIIMKISNVLLIMMMMKIITIISKNVLFMMITNVRGGSSGAALEVFGVAQEGAALAGKVSKAVLLFLY